MNPMSLPSSDDSWKSNDVVSDKFPVGLRVLIVDDDPTCLRILEMMLKNCRYEVTKCNQAEVALKLLRENKDRFDIVMSDVYMPDMDGFTLLERVGLEMDLPVIMMSADDTQNVVMNGIKHGACDYLIKPVRMEALKNIWQHVVRRKKQEWFEKDLDKSGSVEDGEEQPQNPTEDDANYSSPANEDLKNSKKRRAEEDDAEDNGNSSSMKKPRVVWSVELHAKFVKAVNELGIDKAVPKKILEKMDVFGLTRENVASHLQKYRIYLRKLSGQQQQGGDFLLDNAFMVPPGSSYGSKFLASAAHMPYRNFGSIRPSTLGTGKFQVDQRNMLSFELRASLSNTSHQFGTNVNMQHASSSQTGQNISALPQSGQPRSHSRTQILNEVGRNHVLSQGRFPSTTIPCSYGSGSSRPSSLAFLAQSNNFSESSRIHFQDLLSNNHSFQPLVDNSGLASNSNSKASVLQEQHQFNSDMNFPNYDGGFNITEDWDFQHANAPLIEPGFGNDTNVSQQLTSLNLVDQDSSRANKVDMVMPNDMGFENNFFTENLGQDDLIISGYLTQQEAPGPVENYHGYNGYSFDNLQG